MTVEDVVAISDSHQALVVRFSQLWLTDPVANGQKQEYPKGEPPEVYHDDPPSVEHGLSEGFLLGYAVFLKYLMAADDAGLLEYLKKVRIPHAPKVAKALKRVYQQAVRDCEALEDTN